MKIQRAFWIHVVLFLTVMALSAHLSQAAKPIRLHPDNPHYFQYRGKPVILITSAEHYGAVLNLDGTRINLRIAREDEEIEPSLAQSTYGYDHIGLEVEDIHAAYRDLTDRGCIFFIPPREAGGATFAFLKGPENITIELVQS